jgi:hypothetical protein
MKTANGGQREVLGQDDADTQRLAHRARIKQLLDVREVAREHARTRWRIGCAGREGG